MKPGRDFKSPHRCTCRAQDKFWRRNYKAHHQAEAFKYHVSFCKSEAIQWKCPMKKASLPWETVNTIITYVLPRISVHLKCYAMLRHCPAGSKCVKILLFIFSDFLKMLKSIQTFENYARLYQPYSPYLGTLTSHQLFFSGCHQRKGVFGNVISVVLPLKRASGLITEGKTLPETSEFLTCSSGHHMCEHGLFCDVKTTLFYLLNEWSWCCICLGFVSPPACVFWCYQQTNE